MIKIKPKKIKSGGFKRFFPFVLLSFITLVYLAIALIIGQPLLTYIDGWHYTYTTRFEFNDIGYTEDDLKKLSRFEWVEEFYGVFNNTDNVNFMETMDRLKKININIYSPNKITDWSGISNCTELEYIHISGGELVDLESFVNLSKLTNLSIDGKESSRIDLSGINKLSSLEDLTIEGYSVQNYESIETLSELKSVTLTGEAINLLTDLPNDSLERFYYCSNDRRVIDSSELVRLYDLKTISVINTYINNIENLLSLKHLDSIILSRELYTDDELEVFYENEINVTLR